MISEDRLQSLRDTLVAKRAAQEQAIKAYEDAVTDASKRIVELNSFLEKNQEIYLKYPELQSICGLNDASLKDPEVIQNLSNSLELLMDKIEQSIVNII